MTDEERKSFALAAAAQAGEALAELIRFAREGDSHPTAFDPVEVVEKLADATKMALAIDDVADVDGERGQLAAALARYLDGWVG